MPIGRRSLAAGALLFVWRGLSAGADLVVQSVNVAYGECYVLCLREEATCVWSAMVDAGRLKSWMPALALSAYLWTSVPFVRPVAEWLRARNLLRLFTGLLSLALMASLAVWVAKRRSSLKRGHGVTLAGTLTLYATLMVCWVCAPEERLHFLQSGFLACLFYVPLSREVRGGGAAWFACALAAAVVSLEEAIQIFVPSRVFDWQDIGRGITGSFLALPFLLFRTDDVG